jgi:hypothetical protein
MSELVDRLLGEYVAEHRAGGAADPLEYLARAPEDERAELTALIDGYLARAPRRRWNAATFSGSSAEQVVDGLDRALTGTAGRWPIELPRLRERARIRRSDLVRRLAVALEVEDREPKVASYYHQMEQGSLEAERVSNRVLDALAEIVGTTRDALRSAGRTLAAGPVPPAAPGAAAFARKALTDAAYSAEAVAAAPAARRVDDEWDVVDDLFRGGPASG